MKYLSFIFIVFCSQSKYGLEAKSFGNGVSSKYLMNGTSFCWTGGITTFIIDHLDGHKYWQDIAMDADFDPYVPVVKTNWLDYI